MDMNMPDDGPAISGAARFVVPTVMVCTAAFVAAFTVRIAGGNWTIHFPLLLTAFAITYRWHARVEKRRMAEQQSEASQSS